MRYKEFLDKYGENAKVELYDSDENCLEVDLASELLLDENQEVIITSQFEDIFCLTIDSCENEV